MMGRLDGKVAVITGASRGQGAAEARRFVAEGACVVVGDILADEGRALADELGSAARFLEHDVRQAEQWTRIVDRALEAFGKLDVLVNNAGILSLGRFTHEETVEDYQRVIDVNQTGVFLGMRAVIPAMVANGGGSIVNISSLNGLTGRAGTTAYTASKFAVRGMTKCVALEYGRDGIRCNSVHPGGVGTPMRSIHELTEEHGRAVHEANMDRLPIPRVAEPDEIAELVVYLASDASAFCTGAEFVIDGGASAGALDPHRGRV